MDNISKPITVSVIKTSSGKLTAGEYLMVLVFDKTDKLEKFVLADTESKRVKYTSGDIFFGRKSAFDSSLIEFVTSGGTLHQLRVEDGIELGLKRSVDPF